MQWFFQFFFSSSDEDDTPQLKCHNTMYTGVTNNILRVQPTMWTFFSTTQVTYKKGLPQPIITLPFPIAKNLY